MPRRRRNAAEITDPAVAEAFAQARKNLGIGGDSTGISSSAAPNPGDESPADAGESEPRRGRSAGRPAGRLYFKTLADVNRVANLVFNEIRQGLLRASEANAMKGLLAIVADNFRFEKTQARKAEEEAMITQLEALITANQRLRGILVERGIIPASEGSTAALQIAGPLNG